MKASEVLVAFDRAIALAQDVESAKATTYDPGEPQ